jgi:hypothetical protein
VPKTCATWPDAPLTASCSARRLPGRGMTFKGYDLLIELAVASSQFSGRVAWVLATVPAHGR